MYYSIGEVAKQTGIAVSTLRYYDKEGMFPEIERSNGGIRVFSEKELDTIRIIECLESTGLSIKAIKEFLQWCQEGDNSLSKRQEIFHERYEEVKKQIELMQINLQILKYKCWYYDTAVAHGIEDVVKNLSDDEIPKELREYRI